MQIGDIIFIKDTIKPNSYKKLGPIKAFDGKKVIIGVVDDKEIYSKKKWKNYEYVQ